MYGALYGLLSIAISGVYSLHNIPPRPDPRKLFKNNQAVICSQRDTDKAPQTDKLDDKTYVYIFSHAMLKTFCPRRLLTVQCCSVHP
jgi:hypothetical protein